MNKKNTKKLLKVSFFLALALPVFSFAQINLPSNFPTQSDYLKINIRPENPSPNQDVTVNLELYITDLKKAEITWSLNGELKEKGFGLTSFKLNSGPSGQKQTVSILINTFEGGQIRKEIVIRPADVDLVWNANTYTPPFYKGRSLLTGQGENVLAEAIPNFIDSNGKKLNSSVLNYQWYKNNTFLKDQSGIGTNSLSLKTDSIPRPFYLKVVVNTIDGSISSEKRVFIDYDEPTVLVYENSPLYGILFNRAINSIDLTKDEATFIAIPFFFSSSNSNSIKYQWSQNGKIIDQNKSVTFRKVDSNSSGKTEIGVSVKNENDFRQNALNDFDIEIK